MKIYKHPTFAAPIKDFFDTLTTKKLVIHTLAIAIFTAITWPFLSWPLIIVLPLTTEIILFSDVISTIGTFTANSFTAKTSEMAKTDHSSTTPKITNLIYEEEYRAKIESVINFVAIHHHHKFKLTMYSPKLISEGCQIIEHVHPIKILEVIFSSNNLKEQIKIISKDETIWKIICFELNSLLKKEKDRNNLLTYMDHFCTTLNLPKETFLEFIAKNNFEALLNFLISS